MKVVVKVEDSQIGTASLIRGELVGFTGSLDDRVLDHLEDSIEAGKTRTKATIDGVRREISWTISRA